MSSSSCSTWQQPPQHALVAIQQHLEE
ncbi:hypothetical protein HaLaN_29284, partial [Haematococcus lacustris]